MGAEPIFPFAAAAESMLDWWREAGLDALVDEAPRHWLAEPKVAAERPARAESAPTKPVAAPTALPATLAAFNAWRVSEVAPDFGWGNVRIGPMGDAASDVMIMVEAPERDDESAGHLLAGAPGILFDRMLAAIGKSRDSILLASLAGTRPLAGRLPPDAFDDLARIARHHLGLVAPKALLLMGNAPSRAVLGADVALARGSSHVVNHGGATIRTVATFHPRFLLERPAAKGEAWRDLQLLMGRNA